jgi:hypothetical protein
LGSFEGIPSFVSAQPTGIGFFFLCSISSLPLAAVVVAKSATNAGCLPAGIATAIGFVPSILSLEKVGATNADALVMAIPIISFSNAIIAW